MLKLWDSLSTNRRSREAILIELIEKCVSCRKHDECGTSRMSIALEKELDKLGSLFLHRIFTSIRESISLKESPDVYIQFLGLFLNTKSRYYYFSDIKLLSGLETFVNVLKCPSFVSKFCIEQTLHMLHEIVLLSPECKNHLYNIGCLRTIVSLLELYESSTINFLAVAFIAEYRTIQAINALPLHVMTLLNSSKAFSKRAALDLCLRMWCELKTEGLFNQQNLQWTVRMHPQLIRILLCRPVALQYEVSTYCTYTP